jgi:hypothetical protein
MNHPSPQKGSRPDLRNPHRHWTRVLLLLVALAMVVLTAFAVCSLHHHFAPNVGSLPQWMAGLVALVGTVLTALILHGAWKRADWLFDVFFGIKKSKGEEESGDKVNPHRPRAPHWLRRLRIPSRRQSPESATSSRNAQLPSPTSEAEKAAKEEQ